MFAEIKGCRSANDALDAPAVESQRIGRDGDSSRGCVLGLHPIFEVHGGSSAHRVTGPPCAIAHLEFQLRASGHLEWQVEVDPNLDFLARSVGCSVRGTAGNPQSLHLRNGGDAPVDLVLPVGVDGMGAKIEGCCSADDALDAPAIESQRVRSNGDSLRRQVLHIYPVAEPQGIVADKPLK